MPATYSTGVFDDADPFSAKFRHCSICHIGVIRPGCGAPWQRRHDHVASAGTRSTAVSVQGYVDQIIVENKLTGSSQRFPILAADNGQRLVLAGPGVDLLTTGTAIKVTGKQSGHALFPDSVQTLASSDSRHVLAKSTSASTFSGVLRLGHADNFDGSPSEFFFALDSGSGPDTRVALAASLGVLKNGMRVSINGNVAASGELIPESIGITALRT